VEAAGRIALTNYATRLMEELGEIAEAMRLEYFYRDNLRNEVADVFAWLCGLANVLPLAFGSRDVMSLADAAWVQYPDECSHCGNEVCTCRLEPVRQAISEAGVFASEGIDAVTGLPGRERFDFDLERVASSHGVGRLGLILFDCDNFKAYNDETPGGHLQGDRVLAEVAAIAREAVGDRGRLYRFGGDEFVVLLIDPHHDNVEMIAAELDQAAERLEVADVTGEGVSYSVRISCGVARGEGLTDATALIPTADDAMYETKRSRRADR
jgi:diguanylate cyclase (GGDEF)-like protein